jgi:hypothetical protein
MWRDPWTWLAALVRLRLTRINTMKEIEYQRMHHGQTASEPSSVATPIPLKLDEKR